MMKKNNEIFKFLPFLENILCIIGWEKGRFFKDKRIIKIDYVLF